METIRETNTEFIEIHVQDCRKAAYVLDNNLNVSNFKVIGNNLLRIYKSSITPSEISKALILNDIVIESITKKQSFLEDYFLKLINGGVMNA